jgi:hypothetical protein
MNMILPVCDICRGFFDQKNYYSKRKVPFEAVLIPSSQRQNIALAKLREVKDDTDLLEEEHYTLKEETLIGRESDMQRERDRKR